MILLLGAAPGRFLVGGERNLLKNGGFEKTVNVEGACDYLKNQLYPQLVKKGLRIKKKVFALNWVFLWSAGSRETRSGSVVAVDDKEKHSGKRLMRIGNHALADIVRSDIV